MWASWTESTPETRFHPLHWQKSYFLIPALSAGLWRDSHCGMLLVGCELVFPLWRGLCLIHQKLQVRGEFPGGPVVRTLCFHCWGPGFNPWSGSWDLASCVVRPKKKNYKCMIPFLRLHPVASGRHRRGRTQESAHCNLPAMGNCNQQGAPPRPGLPGVDASPRRQEGACPRLGCESAQTSELQDSA